MEVKCKTCKFWEEGHSEIPSLGLCRRYAPRPAASHPLDDPDSIDAVWQRTKDGDWCGEWSAKVLIEAED